jgi:hypothetical protein
VTASCATPVRIASVAHAYEDAVQELYQVPLSQFVAERKRLAGELKRAGDASGAKQLLGHKRPPVSAWVVNQLYWHARDAFDEVLATAERLREGDLTASAAHRDAIATLRKRAATMLEDAGHNASESTLRRVTMTLSALAAAGGFDPDLPGTLAEDRDPPGFEAVGIPLGDDVEASAAPKAAHATPARDDGVDELAKARVKLDKDRAAAEAKQRAAEQAEQKRAEDARKRLVGQRHELERALRAARSELHDHEREVKRLDNELELAHARVARSQELVDGIARELAALADDADPDEPDEAEE